MTLDDLANLTDDNLRRLVRSSGSDEPYICELFRRVPALGALHDAHLAALQGDEADYMAAHPDASPPLVVDVPASTASTQVGDLYRNALNVWLAGGAPAPGHPDPAQEFLTYIWSRGYWTHKDQDEDGRWLHVDIGGHRMQVKLAGQPGALTVLGMRTAPRG